MALLAELAKQGKRGVTSFASFAKAHPLVKAGLRVESPPVSSSALTTYYTCERRFFFRYRLGLIRKGAQTSPALLAGTFFHKAMLTYVEGRSDADVDATLRADANLAIDAATDQNGVTPAGYAEEVTRLCDMAVAMSRAFVGLLKQYHKDLFDPTRYEIMAKEEPIVARVEGLGYRGGIGNSALIAATPDLVVKDKTTGEVEIWDYKTFGRDPHIRASSALFEPATWLYRMAAMLRWPDENITKFIHAVLAKPTIRRRRGETWSDYCVRVDQWYKDKHLENPNSPPIAISTVHLDQEPVITPAKIRMLQEVAQAALRRPHAEWFPQTGAPGACMKFQRLCPYHELCQSDPVLWVDRIALGFIQDFRYEGKDEID